jgi:hypothetical protein
MTACKDSLGGSISNWFQTASDGRGGERSGDHGSPGRGGAAEEGAEDHRAIAEIGNMNSALLMLPGTHQRGKSVKKRRYIDHDTCRDNCDG